MQLDKLIVSAVNEAKHEPIDPTIRCDNRHVAKNDPSGRACKSGEHCARYQGVYKKTVIRLNSYQKVRDKPDGMDRSVTDRSEGLHAEKESPDEQAHCRIARSIDDRRSPDRRIQQAKKEIAYKIK